jgi:uncharacterized protein
MPEAWLWGLLGGLMIGSAAAAFLLLHGRIMGVTGLFGSLLDPGARRDAPAATTIALVFVAGLVVVPALAALVLTPAPATGLDERIWLLVLAGLLVGIGTRTANGCTSGHGVCGISRLAPRGIVATLIYIAAGVVTVALGRHVWAFL